MVYAALGLQVFFLLAAFVLRTVLHLRRTGSTGFRAGARRSRTELLGAGGIALAVFLSAAAVVLGALDVLHPITYLDHTLINALGVATSLVGIGLVLRAQADMGASWRIGVDPNECTELVTSGLFRWSRNPIFLGMIAFWAGIALTVPTFLSVGAVLVAIAAIEVQVRLVEEPYLIKTHGDSYRRYAENTGRLLPGVGRLRR